MREGEAEASPREGRVDRGDALELRGASPEVRVGLPGRGEVGAADLWLRGVKEEERLMSWEVEVERKKKKNVGARLELACFLFLSLSPPIQLTSSCVACAGTWSTSAASCRSMEEEEEEEEKSGAEERADALRRRRRSLDVSRAKK